MDITDFFTHYATEEQCREFFKKQREKKGLNCSCCGSLCFYWIEKESRWKCKSCGKAISLKKDTVMEHSNLGYKVWLWGLYLMSLTKKGFSALEMQRLLGHKRYEPVWLMMHKIRLCMGNRDDIYKLDGYIEMDEGFFEGHRKKEPSAKELDRQVKVIVAVSTEPVSREQQKPYHHSTKAGHLKMNVVSSLGCKDAAFEIPKIIKDTAIVKTDGKACYNVLKDICTKHEKIVVDDKKEVCKIFPWVHTAISNAKKKILGLHHQVKDGYMQNYLNEFCYKFNRRFFGQALFDRLLIATLSNPWYQAIPKCG